ELLSNRNEVTTETARKATAIWCNTPRMNTNNIPDKIDKIISDRIKLPGRHSERSPHSVTSGWTK
ncbi:MAG: hypothetical protein WCY30_09925, partial [Candidatus Neomarinimicrobiota bacterium]